MGLIGNVLQPLYAGAPCVLMSPVAFLQRPLRWLEAISRYRATTSGGPNFAYDLCVRKIDARADARGARPVAAGRWPSTAPSRCAPRRWSASPRPSPRAASGREAFYPCYGLAEATLFVTGGAAGAAGVEPFAPRRWSSDEAVPARPATADARWSAAAAPGRASGCAIVDPETAAALRAGTRWARSGSPARASPQGYWSRPEETRARRSARGSPTAGDGPFLRTGDLGSCADGELFVTGRLKDLIILRGRNHYPQDIELTAERSHPALRPGCGAAFSVDVDGEERLVVVQEVERTARRRTSTAVAEAVRRAVAEEHEVQVHEVVLIAPGTHAQDLERQDPAPRLPRALSGRASCRWSARAPLAQAGDGSAVDDAGAPAARTPRRAPSDARRLAAAREVAGACGVAAGDRPDQPLAALGPRLAGGRRAEARASRRRSASSCRWPTCSKGVSLGELAARSWRGSRPRLPTPRRPARPSPPRAAATGDRRSPTGQRALWFLHRLAPESAAYNIAVAARVRGRSTSPALRRALASAWSTRHPALRTTFPAGPTASRCSGSHARWRSDFAGEDAAGWSESRCERGWQPRRCAALRPRARARCCASALPARRARRARCCSSPSTTSSPTSGRSPCWLRELARSTQRGGGPAPARRRWPLATPTSSAGRRSCWPGAEGERLLELLARAAGRASCRASTCRPTGRARRSRPTAAARARWRSAAELAGAARRRSAGSREATLFMTLLAAFQALLAPLHRPGGPRWSARRPPAAPRAELGRAGRLLRQPGGRCAPTLAGDPTLRRAPGADAAAPCSAAFAHQDFPLPAARRAAAAGRDPSRSPLFQVDVRPAEGAPRTTRRWRLRARRGRSADRPRRPGLESLAAAAAAAQFDLTLTMAEAAAGSAPRCSTTPTSSTRATVAAHGRALRRRCSPAAVAEPAGRVARAAAADARPSAQQLLRRLERHRAPTTRSGRLPPRAVRGAGGAHARRRGRWSFGRRAR